MDSMNIITQSDFNFPDHFCFEIIITHLGKNNFSFPKQGKIKTLKKKQRGKKIHRKLLF